MIKPSNRRFAFDALPQLRFKPLSFLASLYFLPPKHRLPALPKRNPARQRYQSAGGPGRFTGLLYCAATSTNSYFRATSSGWPSASA